MVDNELCLWDETQSSSQLQQLVLSVVKDNGYTAADQWGCDLYASRYSRVCEKYFSIGRKPTIENIRETAERALWAFPPLRPHFGAEASSFDAVQLMTELYNDRLAVWDVAALVVPVPPYLQQHEWDEAATKDETGWITSLKRDPHVAGVILTGPMKLTRVTRGRDGPMVKPYDRELGVIVFTRKPRTEQLPWLHRVEPVHPTVSGSVLIQGTHCSVDAILRRANLSSHSNLCRVPVRNGVTALHLFHLSDEEKDRLVDAADADERHQLDVLEPTALEMKEGEQLALFCFTDRTPPVTSLTHRVRKALAALCIDPRRVAHTTTWAVEVPLKKPDIEKMRQSFADWSRTGLRMKVAGEWVTRPAQRTSLEIHHMPPCSPTEAVQMLRKVGIQATSVTRATRVLRNGPRKVSGTWNVEVHGVQQSDIVALRGRMYLRLETGSLVTVVAVEQPRDINSMLRRPLQPWGGRRIVE